VARPASKMNKGYYPTPKHLVPLIAKYLEPPENPENARLLDPCCGKGEALDILGRALGFERSRLFGNELDERRFLEAEKRFTTVCGDALFELQATQRAFGLLYENPPYDFEGDGDGRTEFRFLQAHYRFLCNGGVLVYIVPEKTLHRKEVAKALPNLFKRIRVLRFPEKDYASFGQVVLLGKKSRGVCRTEQANYISQLQNPVTLGDELDLVYEVPESAVKSFKFFSLNLTGEQIKAMAGSEAVRRLVDMGLARPVDREVKCLMTLREGHLALLLASGMMDGAYRDPETGNVIVISGMVVRETTTKTEHHEDKTIEKVLHRPNASIQALDLDASLREGEIVTLNFQ